ncbi:hypothetical protein K435DRAFT_743134 [Dendrothele bispora CBS 962.96]|uniref:Secreted protein n=1 Tax=Dendrothele bispora (strain CBS 962.96) TaxID=1314807 RepID=A0A4S8MU10_DENBC|nr:hypothetical protein K435DRAFT_743134 [Dendrothele bispora CBS 962.96]
MRTQFVAFIAQLIFLLPFTASFAKAQKLPQDLPQGSFATPKTGVKWRFWIEDAAVDLDILRSDISEMSRVGASGFQFLCFQDYGGPVLIDPTEVAFGSDRFVNVTAVAIEAAIANNLTIDFTTGPAQGAGVPVFPDDVDMDGMNTELVFGSHFLEAGEHFDGPLPAPTILPFRNNLGSPVTGVNVTTMKLIGVIGASLAPGSNTSANRDSLDFNSVVDLTPQVQGSVDDSTASISWTPSFNGTSVLLAYFSRRNGFPEARGGFNGPEPDKPGSWGSFVVDHFSPSGANITAQFIDSNILAREDIGALLKQPGVGQYMWEDSMEFVAQVFWTAALPERFLERHGYNTSLALPVLHSLRPSIQSQVPNQTFDYGDSIDSNKFTNDYADTLTSLYIDYMTAVSTWARSVGLTYSNQPAYNFHLDTAASAAIPDTPEIESLGVPLIDEARQLSGGVHLGNRTIFSSETAARPGEAYAIRMIEILEDAKTQYAGSVNVVMLHGLAHSSDYPNTTWPGFTTFQYRFAEMHGPRMPAWDYYREYLDFLARTQHVLQQGVAKVDLAVYRKGYDITTDQPFQGTSLIEAGYTYEYVSPENFKLPGVSVVDGRLAPSGPAYKAFVLSRISNITVDAAQTLVEYADSGLPIVFVGSTPDDIPGFEIGDEQKSKVQNLMDELVGKPTVKIVDNEEDVASALAGMGVSPAASANPESPNLYTIVRQVEDESGSGMTAHYYLFNSNVSTSGSVTGPINFTLTLNPGFKGTPFTLDPWTGEVNPVAVYTVDDDGVISIPSVSLAPAQTALFTVTTLSSLEGVDVPSSHLTGVDADVSVVGFSDTAELRSFEDGEKQISFSNGSSQTVSFSLKGETTRELDGWELNITAWTPPADITVNQTHSLLVPLTPINLTQGLLPWDQLEVEGVNMTNISGVGTYVTSFEWDHTEDDGVGVQLDFGEVFHTVKAWLNGVQIPTADPTNPVVDISALVKQGTNTLRVDTASTFTNAINALGLEVISLGVPHSEDVDNQHYGLIAPVTLVPYGRVNITL